MPSSGMARRACAAHYSTQFPRKGLSPGDVGTDYGLPRPERNPPPPRRRGNPCGCPSRAQRCPRYPSSPPPRRSCAGRNPCKRSAIPPAHPRCTGARRYPEARRLLTPPRSPCRASSATLSPCDTHSTPAPHDGSPPPARIRTAPSPTRVRGKKRKSVAENRLLSYEFVYSNPKTNPPRQTGTRSTECSWEEPNGKRKEGSPGKDRPHTGAELAPYLDTGPVSRNPAPNGNRGSPPV